MDQQHNMHVRVFYSYAHTDERLRKQLVAHLSNLKRQGLIAEWYDRNINAGLDWAHEIDSHLNAAHVILLLLSADFISSEYCYSLEAKRAMERHEAGEARVIPILLRPTDWKGTPFEKLQVLPRNAKPVTKWQNRDDAFLDIAMGIRNAVEELSVILSDMPLSFNDVQVLEENKSPSLDLWHIPYRRNPFFTGREDTLQNLHDALRVDKAIALSQPQTISGLGGIGKTQTVLEYAYRYCNDYGVILWANADTRETLVSDLIIIAGVLKLPEKNEQDQTLIVHAIKRWLQAHSNWLMILDNVEHLEVVSELIPQFIRGHILITTRLQTLGMFASQIEIDKMEPDMAALFLLRRARIIAPNALLTDASDVYQSQAQEIIQIMDGLPLALDQVGSYIDETKCSLLHYLALYQARRTELLKRRGQYVSNHPESVTTTFLLSFERIQQSNLAATELLKLFAFLYPGDIPEEILIKGSLDLGPIIQPVAADRLALDEAIAELLKYSLLRRDPDAQTLTIHRLVQAVLSDMMDKNMQCEWAERAVRAINRAFPDVEFGTWEICQRLLPQAEASARLIQQWNMEFAEAARLLYQAASYLHARSQLTQALPLYQQTLTIREKVLGLNHPDTAASLSNLGWLYYTQGDFTQAKLLSQRALTIREKMLGLNHPDTAASLSQLGVLYRAQGNFEQAERSHRQAMEIYLKTKGLKDRDTAFSLHNLAALYRMQHKYAQGELLAQQALDIRKEVLGLEHPDTTFSLISLAELYKDQNKYDQAESLFQQAAVIREKILGPEHPSLAYSLNHLARLYLVQQKYDRAEPLFQRSLVIYEQAIDPLSPDVAFTLNQIARLYKDQGKYDQAEPFYQRALMIAEHVWGPKHMYIARYLNNLAKLYQAQGKYVQAQSFYQQALEIYEQVMGSEARDIANVLNDIAALLREMKKEGEAQKLEVRAQAILTKSSDKKKPHINKRTSN